MPRKRRCPRFGVDLCVPVTRGDADCATCERETRTGPQARAAQLEAMRFWREFKLGRRYSANKEREVEK